MDHPTLTRRRVLALSAATAAAAVSIPLQAKADWRSGPDLPARVQEIYPAVLDGRVYVAGGLSPDAGRPIGVSSLFASWDGQASAWQQHAPLPVATHHMALAATGDRILACGGFVAGDGDLWRATAAVHIYDPARDEWTSGPALPTAQAEVVPVTLGDDVHLVGGREAGETGGAGYGDNRDTARHLVLGAGDGRWREAAPLPGPRNSAAGAVLAGALHVVGGRTMDGASLDAHLRYDATADRWDTLAPLPVPERGPSGGGGLAAAARDGTLFAFGGEWFTDGGGVYAEVWHYDPAADRWAAWVHMATPRHGLGAVSLSGMVVTIGGATGPGIAGTSRIVEILG